MGQQQDFLAQLMDLLLVQIIIIGSSWVIVAAYLYRAGKRTYTSVFLTTRYFNYTTD